MSDLHVKYLLIGGGVAALSAAGAIRRMDSQGALMLVGQEINRPYYRTPLSKAFLLRRATRSSLFACEPDWFSAHHVQLHTGCRAAHLDASRHVVTLDNGQAISYDLLLLATGANPRALNLLGGNLPNVFALRTIEDFEQLHTAIDKARTEGHRHPGGRGRAVVIGGGLMGVEVAAGLAESGLAADLVVGGPHPWAKFAGEATGKFLSHFLTRKGVTVHDGARAARVEGDGRAQRVVLADGGILDCDFAVAAVGTVPNKELLRGTAIMAEKAILTDEHCYTNYPDIYAAGDCAAVRDPIFGKHRPADQWDTAAATGTVAGANMAGADVRFEAVTTFTTEIGGLTARAWGHSKHLSRRLLRGTPNVESPDFLEIGIADDGRVSQVLAVGFTGDATVLEELVRQRVRIEGNEEALKDPTSRLQDLLGSH
jgi:3-phenylpropionate/trans-cinnamate dioxygenase ferredoxin reductase component